MYSSVSIKNFRGIGSLRMENLQRVNLIVGRNNAGKSTLLESLFLLGSSANASASFTVGNLRGHWIQNGESAWRPLFHKADPRHPIEISADLADSKRHLEISAIPVDAVANFNAPAVSASSLSARAPTDMMGSSSSSAIPQPTRTATVSSAFVIGGIRFTHWMGGGQKFEGTVFFNQASRKYVPHIPDALNQEIISTGLVSIRGRPGMQEIAQEFSALVKAKQVDEIILAMKLIDPRISEIQVLSEDGVPALYMDVGLGSLLPLAVAGEGLLRLFEMAMTMASVRGGVLLIDEIDNGLHHSVMGSVWRFLAKQAETFGVQVFATTHNDEMIRSALHALKNGSGLPGLFRIDVRDGRHEIASYGAEAIEAVLESNFEVRA